MRKRIEEDKKKRGIPASDSEDEKRSGGELIGELVGAATSLNQRARRKSK